MEFKLQLTPQHDKSDLEGITQLRREYAKDLSSNKKFLFGKYLVSPEGIVWIFSFFKSFWYIAYRVVMLGS